MKANAVIATHEKTGVSQVSVVEGNAGMRLDRFLKQQLPGCPAGLIQKLLRTGQVRLDGGRVKGDHRLEVGQTIRIPPVRVPSEVPSNTQYPPPQAMLKALEGCVLLEGAGFMVINKPPGWPVHGGSGQAVGLIDGLRYLWKDRPDRPELCHRLDRDTSGCLLLATHRQAASMLTALFRDDKVEKTYLALVRGIPHPSEGMIDASLVKGVVKSGERMVLTDDAGQHARTRYRVSERYDQASLLTVTLETGRTHQVRAHVASIHHPLAGDYKYGDRPFNRTMKSLGLRRMFLHAHTLTFPHPGTGAPVQVTAPLDPALVAFLEKLRHHKQP